MTLDEILRKVREMEDLFFRLVSISAHDVRDENALGFDSLLDQPPPREEQLLSVDSFPDTKTDDERVKLRESFAGFGGQIAVEGFLRIGSVPTCVIFYRGAGPEWPRAHEASPPDDPVKNVPAPLPAHAQTVFGSKPAGDFGGVPWALAKKEKMQLEGLADSAVYTFRSPSGKVLAFFMVTDADIDTDGPSGSIDDDPHFQGETSLRFSDGHSCNSRAFPGVVRSVRLREAYGLKLGDFALLCHNGRIVECQVYDQGRDDKIGEISVFAARQLGGVPPTMTDRQAAIGGNFTDELVTLFFPGSSDTNRAVSNAEIAASARRCFEDFTGRSIADPDEISPGTQPHEDPAESDAALVIHPREAWGARKPLVPSFEPSAAEGIVIHNTQDPNRDPADGDEELQIAFGLSRRIQRSHMEDRGWSDIGQHFTISRGGVVMEARHGTLAAARAGQVVRGAHAGAALYNRTWFGIEIEGDFRKALKITSAQRAALVELCAWLCKQGAFSATQIKGHKDVKPGNGTDCPGKMLGEIATLQHDVAARVAALG
jgi:hypothetical protein